MTKRATTFLTTNKKSRPTRYLNGEKSLGAKSQAAGAHGLTIGVICHDCHDRDASPPGEARCQVDALAGGPPSHFPSVITASDQEKSDQLSGSRTGPQDHRPAPSDQQAGLHEVQEPATTDGTRAAPRRGSSDRCRQDRSPAHGGRRRARAEAKPVLRWPNLPMRCTDGCAVRPDLLMTSRVPSRVQTAGNNAGGPHSSACLLRLNHPVGCRVGWCPRSRWSGIRRIVSRAIPARASGTCRYAVLAQPTSPPASSHSSVVSPLVAASRRA